jgi:tetratricopeptide (TPR) repeat protein
MKKPATTIIVLLLAAVLPVTASRAADAPDTGQLEWYASPRARPNFPPAVDKLVSQGIALMTRRKWQAAIARFDEAIRAMPRAAAIYENRAACYQQLGKFERAIADYTRALQLAPELAPVVYENRAYCYKGLGELALALADFNHALELAPQRQNPLLLSRGRLLVDMGETKKAEQDFNKALAFRPIRAQAYSELAYIAIGRRDFPLCLSLASRAIRTDPRFPEGWANRGACQISLGRYPQAIHDLSIAIALDPAVPATYLNRSAAYAALGDCPKALNDANAAVRLAPEKADVARRLVAPCRAHPPPAGGPKLKYM